MADESYNHYSSSDVEDSNSQDAIKEQQPPNIFRNDGSFMEMFKKMQEEQKKQEEEGTGEGKSTVKEEQQPPTQQKKTPFSFVGKRRGGRVLATGMVKKQRKAPQTSKESSTPEGGKTDAWSQYMNEVRKYKEQSCEEEGKRRPLVK